MQIVKGKYNEAVVLATNVDLATLNQIHNLCDQKWVEGLHIVIQPDAHCGAGCVIGTTMTIKDKICPNLVGVDIGCGFLSYNLGKLDKVDFELLDKCVHKVPSGMKVWDTHQNFEKSELIEELECKDELKNIDRLNRSMGTLGGGNHAIELGKSEKTGDYWLSVHSGSRNLGLQVADYYQEIASQLTTNMYDVRYNNEKEDIINKLQKSGKQDKISEKLNELKNKYNEITPPAELAYLTDENYFGGKNGFRAYLHDHDICKTWAMCNRRAMLNNIIRMYNGGAKEKFEIYDMIETIHNYIDTDHMILRKGSVSAQKGERFLLPINMAEGIYICEGLGLKEYNYSAPHGAGRVGSRKQAKKTITMEEYRKSMEGIYSTSISEGTLDEAPQAYKKSKDILPNLKESVKVIEHIKPVYNFKAE